jgi:tripartite-type tricarboxylate transporter receptor subunit TctC
MRRTTKKAVQGGVMYIYDYGSTAAVLRKATVTCGLAIALSMLAIGSLSAADYPSRPIKIIVGFTAGGPTDIPVRYIADKLSKAMGQPVIVENKPGAASMLAIREMLSQARDGYTLLSCTYFDPVNTKLYRNADYKASDIEPITLIAKYDYAITVPLDGPIKSVSDLVQYAKQHPGKVNYGHLGQGSTQNLIAKQLESAADINITGIPYKGAADAIQDIVAGRLDLFFGPPVVVMPQYKGERLRVIAVTGKKRLSAAPEVPTLMESGIPIDAFGWIGLCAGKGTPKSVIDLLDAKLVPILKSPEYEALIEKSGSVPVSTTPQQTQAVIDETLRDVSPLIAKYNLHLD